MTMLRRTARPTATPDPGGTAGRGVAVVAVDEDQDHREEQHLEERQQDVDRWQEQPEVVVVGAGGLAVEGHGHDPGAEVGRQQPDHVERDHRDQPGDHPGGDQERQALDRHHLERVDLLGDPHRAELGGEAGADRRREGERRDQRRDLAGVEVGRDEAVERRGADLVQGGVALHADDGAGEQAHPDHHADGAADDGQGARAEGHLGQQPHHLARVRRERARRPAQRADVEPELAPEPGQPVDRRPHAPRPGTSWR